MNVRQPPATGRDVGILGGRTDRLGFAIFVMTLLLLAATVALVLGLWRQLAQLGASLHSVPTDVPTEALAELRAGLVLLIGFLVMVVLGAIGFAAIGRYARAEAETQRARLEDAIEALPDGFALYDAGGHRVLSNRRYRELCPQPPEESGQPGATGGEATKAQRVDGDRVLRVGESRTREGGRVELLVDLTELEGQRVAHARSEARFRALAETAPIGIWQIDRDGRTAYANSTLCRMLGADAAALAGRPPGELFLSEDAERLAELLAQPQAVPLELTLRGEAGGGRTVLVAAAPLCLDGEDGGTLLTLLDVTAQKRAREEIEHLALHDPLTGLGNRRLFDRTLDSTLARCEPFVLLLIDLDRFAQINDRFGHTAGDRLLIEIGERLRACTRGGDVAVRLGGDEFALVVREVEEGSRLVGIAERVRECLSRPVQIEGHQVRLQASFGVVTAPAHGHLRDVLMRHGELALSVAKRHGSGRIVVYEAGLCDGIRRRTLLKQRLERAIENSELDLFVQPQISLADGRPRGGEILVRWFDPVERTAVPPAEFVALGEESDLIFELDAWVLERACAWLAGFRGAGQRPPMLAINVSAAHTGRPELPALVADILTRNGLDAASLELELTEHVLVDNHAAGRRLLEDLHAIGVELALDDFGTGYSSLAYLADLPFDRLKIDKNFVGGVECNAHHRTIVRAIVGLGHGLGMEVVAEGVETAWQRDFLVRAGCDMLQGYLIGRPMPLDHFGDWLVAWDAAAWRRALRSAGGRRCGSTEERDGADQLPAVTAAPTGSFHTSRA